MSPSLPIHSLARAVIIDKNYLLLCQHIWLPERPCTFYFLPGGHIEEGESAIQAVQRELLEETSFSFQVTRFLGCLEYRFTPENPRACHQHEYNFIFQALSSDVTCTTFIPQTEPHIQCKWVSLEDLHPLDLKPLPLKRLIPLWIQHKNETAFQSTM